MPTTLSLVLTIVIGLALVLLLSAVYLRNQQGDQRTIAVSGSMIIPLLSAVSVVTGYLYQSPTRTMVCSSGVNTFIIGGIIAVVILLVGGVLFYLVRPQRDIRTLAQPSLLAAIVITAVFVVAIMGGCL